MTKHLIVNCLFSQISKFFLEFPQSSQLIMPIKIVIQIYFLIYFLLRSSNFPLCFDRLDSCFLSPHRIYHLYSLFHSKFTVWQRLRVFKKHLVYWFRFLYCASLIFWHFQIYKLRIGCWLISFQLFLIF